MAINPFEKGVRWGIIGAGDVCEVKSGPALSRIEGSRLVAVMRRDGAKARDYAHRHGVPRWYDDADKLIRDPEVNAVYIATPPDSHERYTLKVAAAGKPVYVEKPMARTHAECLNMVEACRQAGVPLFVAYYRRALPVFLKAKALIEEGAIGEVRFVDIQMHKPLGNADREKGNWRVAPEIAGGGYFYDLGSHQLDLMDFFFGPVKEARGFAANQAGAYPAEDLVLGAFRFENGIMGQGSWCFNTSENAALDRTTAYGSKGILSFPFFGDYHIALKIEGKPEEMLRFDSPKHVQQPLIQTVVDELMGRGKCPSSGISGARTNRVMEQVAGCL